MQLEEQFDQEQDIAEEEGHAPSDTPRMVLNQDQLTRAGCMTHLPELFKMAFGGKKHQMIN